MCVYDSDVSSHACRHRVHCASRIHRNHRFNNATNCKPTVSIPPKEDTRFGERRFYLLYEMYRDAWVIRYGYRCRERELRAAVSSSVLAAIVTMTLMIGAITAIGTYVWMNDEAHLACPPSTVSHDTTIADRITYALIGRITVDQIIF